MAPTRCHGRSALNTTTQTDRNPEVCTKQTTMKIHQILASGIALLALTLPSNAGSNVAKTEPKPEPKTGITFANGLVTIDLEGRLRFEARSNNRDFDDSANEANDDSWLLSRFRIGVALQPTDWLKFYAQTQDTREWDSDRVNVAGVNGTEGGDTFDLRQAYVELANYKKFPLGLTVGRQILSYGDHRQIADSKWGNYGRTFDGVKLRLQTDVFWVDAFAARPVQIKDEVINDSDSADNFFGVYGGTDALGVQTTEFYFLYRDKADNQPDLNPTTLDSRGSWNGPAQRISTVGTRWKSKKGALSGWDYTAEFAYQFGEVWTGDRSTPRLSHHAFATAISGGYTWESAGWKPRLGLEYDFASGDGNPTDGSNNSYYNLFPSSHAKFGSMDEHGWRNLHDAHLSISAKPAKAWEVIVDYHALWLANTTDYWYRGNGVSTLRTTTPSGANVRTVEASNFAGHELDLTVKWAPTEYLKFDVGYAHYFAGDYLADTGASDDADFGYVQATVTF